jgi:hypothetical protein
VWWLGEMRLYDLRPADDRRFVVEKLKSDLSWNTVRHLRNLASRILRAVKEWDFISANATRGVRLPPKQLSGVNFPNFESDGQVEEKVIQ